MKPHSSVPIETPLGTMLAVLAADGALVAIDFDASVSRYREQKPPPSRPTGGLPRGWALADQKRGKNPGWSR
jgi:hypothetical protein